MIKYNIPFNIFMVSWLFIIQYIILNNKLPIISLVLMLIAIVYQIVYVLYLRKQSDMHLGRSIILWSLMSITSLELGLFLYIFLIHINVIYNPWGDMMIIVYLPLMVIGNIVRTMYITINKLYKEERIIPIIAVITVVTILIGVLLMTVIIK